MAISVMVVDDEKIVIDLVCDYIDNQKFNIVCHAHNGDDGYKKYLKYRPQIIITDIKMPVLDGISMAKKILSVDFRAKFIMLTAYDDFHFLRAVVKLGIREYVLKHELDDRIVINEKLDAIYAIIEKEKDQEFIDKQSKLFDLIIHNKNDCKDENAILKNTKKNNTWLCEIRIQQYVQDGVFADCLKMSFSNRKIEFHFCRISNETFCVLAKVDNPRQDIAMQILYESLYDMILKLKKFSLIALIGISKEIYEMDAIGISYGQMKDMMEHYFFLESSKIQLFSQYAEPEFNKRIYAIKIDELRLFVRENDTDKCVSLLNQIFDLLIKHGSKKTYDEIMKALIQTICEHNVQLNMIEVHDGMEAWKNIYDAKNAIIDLYEKNTKSRKIDLVNIIIRFINDNYKEDISIDSIANLIDKTHAYACQIFKKSIGITIVSYITKIRIDCSTRLLLETSMKITDISKSSGFHSVHYFCNTFKRHTGLSPNEFRALKG